MCKKILILDAEEAPYPLTISRSLGSAGHVVHLGFPYGSHVFAAYSKFCKQHLFYPDPSYALNDFLEFFKNLAGKYDFIIPTMEKSQLALSEIKEYMEKMGTVIPVPNHELLNVAVNKAKILEIASKNQLKPPTTILLTAEPELKDIINKLGLPFIMKTSTETNVPPGPSNRYFVIKREIPQKDFLIKFRKLNKYGPVILQQYVEGVGIGVSFIFSTDCKPIAIFGHRRILEHFPEGGPSIIAETYFHPEAIMQGFKLLTALNWQGVAMTEFKLGPDGTLYFMEINPRFWGTLPLALASGIDFPKLLIDHYTVSQKNLNPALIVRQKIFINFLRVSYSFIISLKMRNLDFAEKIFRASLKTFKYGFPFVVESEKLDLSPEIKRLNYTFNEIISKNKVSKIGRVFFGPVIPYGKLAKFHIRSVIDLREESEKAPDEVRDNIDYNTFPITDDSAPELASFLPLIYRIDQIVKNGPVYIHCRIGHGRAPMTVIAYLVSKGVPIDKAYSIVYDARPYACPNLIQKSAIYAVYKSYSRVKPVE